MFFGVEQTGAQDGNGLEVYRMNRELKVCTGLQQD